MFSQLLVFIVEQKKPSKNKTADQYGYENWINPANTTAIELPETERAFFKLAENNGWYQKTGYDKKDIYTNETAFHIFRKRVKNENSEYSQCSKSIDIWTIT